MSLIRMRLGLLKFKTKTHLLQCYTIFANVRFQIILMLNRKGYEGSSTLKDKRIKDGVIQFVLGCAAHSAPTGCHKNNLNAHLPYTMNCGDHSMNKSVYYSSQIGLILIHVVVVGVDHWGKEGLVGLGGESESGTWSKVHATTVSSFYWVLRSSILPEIGATWSGRPHMEKLRWISYDTMFLLYKYR